MKYSIFYQAEPIIDVEIADDKDTAKRIKEMVRFWGAWELKWKEAGGDYTKCWLKMLARFFLENGYLPGGKEEGWYDLNGTKGIKVTWQCLPEIDSDFIDIRETP
jgi:hypothetical protein